MWVYDVYVYILVYLYILATYFIYQPFKIFLLYLTENVKIYVHSLFTILSALTVTQFWEFVTRILMKPLRSD